MEQFRRPADQHLLERRFSLRGSNLQVDAARFLLVDGSDPDWRGKTVEKRLGFISSIT